MDDGRRLWRINIYHCTSDKKKRSIFFYGRYDECVAYGWSICGYGGNIEILLDDGKKKDTRRNKVAGLQ